MTAMASTYTKRRLSFRARFLQPVMLEGSGKRYSSVQCMLCVLEGSGKRYSSVQCMLCVLEGSGKSNRACSFCVTRVREPVMPL
jgi:hypothetical protein